VGIHHEFTRVRRIAQMVGRKGMRDGCCWRLLLARVLIEFFREEDFETVTFCHGFILRCFQGILSRQVGTGWSQAPSG